MKRTSVLLSLLMGIFPGLHGADKPAQDPAFPPVPEWKPAIQMPEARIIDRMSYYTDGGKDFVVLSHGTCVIVPDGLTDEQAAEAALEIISKIFHQHPDMHPAPMDDGNILVRYKHPAYNVVLDEITKAHMEVIEANHLKALAKDEVLITPLGPNKFDAFSMKALFGRCYFFMDAKKPVVSRVIRKRVR